MLATLGLASCSGAFVGFLIKRLGYFEVSEEYFNDSSHVFFDNVLDYWTDLAPKSGWPLTYTKQPDFPPTI